MLITACSACTLPKFLSSTGIEQDLSAKARRHARSADEFGRLRHAIEKADGDRDRAIRNVCRLYGVKALDALPPGIRATALAPPWVRKKMILDCVDRAAATCCGKVPTRTEQGGR
jgi:hypothetical protein